MYRSRQRTIYSCTPPHNRITLKPLPSSPFSLPYLRHTPACRRHPPQPHLVHHPLPPHSIALSLSSLSSSIYLFIRFIQGTVLHATTITGLLHPLLYIYYPLCLCLDLSYLHPPQSVTVIVIGFCSSAVGRHGMGRCVCKWVGRMRKGGRVGGVGDRIG